MNDEWLYLQLNVIYHEFAHIVHQRYNLPANWQQISPEGYTSLVRGIHSPMKRPCKEALLRHMQPPILTKTMLKRWHTSYFFQNSMNVTLSMRKIARRTTAWREMKAEL